MFWVHPYSIPHEAALSIATRPRRSASAASRLPCCLTVTPCFLQRDVLAPASRSRNAGRSGHYGEEPSESEAGPQAVQAAEQVGARALILPSLGPVCMSCVEEPGYLAMATLIWDISFFPILNAQ